MNPHEMDGAEPPPPGVKTAAAIRWVIIGGALCAAAFSLFVAGRRGGGASTPDDAAGGGGESAPVMVDESSEIPGLSSVDLTGEKIQRIGVRLAPVSRREIADPVKTVATLSADLSRVARVQTRVSGWLESVAVSAPGVRVRKGQTLATIYSPELFTAEQELLDAKRWSGDDAARLVETARQRMGLAGVSAEDVAAIEAKGTPIRALPIRAPIDGFVSAPAAVQGASVNPGTELYEIADLTHLWAWIDVYERDLEFVRPGLAVDLAFPALPGRRFPGTVALVDPRLDPATRTLKARVDLKNGDLALKPGMYGDATVATSPRTALVVPAGAVVDTGESQYVFVERAPGHFVPRLVHAGATVEGVTVALDGLVEGEQVVAAGNFLLDSESRLRTASAHADQGPARADIPIDREKFPEKYRQWLDCERVHRGMGSMEEDCKNAIPKPWK